MKTPANKITPRMFYDHAIRREYMSGVSREKSRVKATGEVFTPDGLVVEPGITLPNIKWNWPDLMPRSKMIPHFSMMVIVRLTKSLHWT